MNPINVVVIIIIIIIKAKLKKNVKFRLANYKIRKNGVRGNVKQPGAVLYMRELFSILIMCSATL